MFKRNFRTVLLMLFALLLALTSLASAAPKYVFYFIGDGLGASQRQAAEYYLQAKTGNPDAKLLINQLPYAGITTTHSADSLITDSAAAGTALATGFKTNNGMISMLPDGTVVKTLVEAAEEKGMATGIVTSTRLTHATPAVFAAHNPDRDNENEIAADFVDSGVDYFAGGGYRHFVPQNGSLKSKRKDDRNLVQEFADSGYKVFVSENDTKNFREYTPSKGDKVFAAFTYSHLPYEIDRDEAKVPSLAELTKKGIDLLSQQEKGFFMMVEGGRIDHACHAHDPVGAIQDILAFDAAVKEAYNFFQKHPAETLIVVVGDHETGGLGLGFGKNYFLKMEELFDAKVSTAETLQGVYDGDRGAFYNYVADNFGLNDLTDAEKAEVEQAMEIVDRGDKEAAGEYGGYDPVAIAVTHILSERANLYWTTYAHSATQIPMSAIGVDADKFAGFKDNTEIAKTMASVLGFAL